MTKQASVETRHRGWALAVFAACITLGAVGAADPVTAALERKLLPGGNYIVYDNMLKAVYEADLAADEAWTACKTPAELIAHQRAVRTALIEALGGFPERCPLNMVTTGRVVRDGYTVENIYFESQPNHHVTANLFLPDPVKFPGKRPGIVVPCGHSTNGKAAPAYQRGSLQAAQAGMVAPKFGVVPKFGVAGLCARKWEADAPSASSPSAVPPSPPRTLSPPNARSSRASRRSTPHARGRSFSRTTRSPRASRTWSITPGVSTTGPTF